MAKSFGDRRVGLWITEIGWALGGRRQEPYVKGDAGQARLLEKAYDERFNRLAYLRREGMWQPMRQNPRFQDLLRRINLPE